MVFLSIGGIILFGRGMIQQLASRSVNVPGAQQITLGNRVFVRWERTAQTGYTIYEKTTMTQILESPSSGALGGIYASGNFLYSARAGKGEVEYWNSFTVMEKNATFASNNLKFVQYSKNYAYFLNSTGGLLVANATNAPNDLVLLGAVNTSSVEENPKLAVSGNYVYIAMGRTPRLNIIDVTNPTNPSILSYYEDGDPVEDVVVNGSYAYIFSAQGHFRIIDVSDPASPVRISSLKINATLGTSNSLCISHSPERIFIYLACKDSGIGIINALNPFTPALLGFWTTSDPANDVEVAGGKIYVITSGGVEILAEDILTQENIILWNLLTSNTSLTISLFTILLGYLFAAGFMWSRGKRASTAPTRNPKILRNTVISTTILLATTPVLLIIITGTVDLVYLASLAVIIAIFLAGMMGKYSKFKKVSKVDVKKGISVFMSYAHADVEIFDIPAIAQGLQKFPDMGNVFYSHRDVTDNFVAYMNEALGISQVMILFCTGNSLQSRYVESEWTAAEAAKRPIIPVFLNADSIPVLLRSRDGVQLNLDHLEEGISEIHDKILRKLKDQPKKEV